jgi:hypothetical protein
LSAANAVVGGNVLLFDGFSAYGKINLFGAKIGGAFIYSLENCLPVIKLGQDERWQPDPNPKTLVPPASKGKFGRAVNWLSDLVPVSLVTPKWLRFFRWAMIIVGWVLAIYFVAGLTAVIKTK